MHQRLFDIDMLKLMLCYVANPRTLLWDESPLNRSPYFKCLVTGINNEESKKIYDDYMDLLKINYVKLGRCSNSITTYEYFINLYEEIKNNGFDYDLEPKVKFKTKDVTTIGDGQHRMAILLFLSMKKVLIRFNSGALGDTVLWFPYTEKYRIEHKLDKIWVNCKDLWADTFFKPVYPNHILNSNHDPSSFNEIYDISCSVDAEKNRITYPSFQPLQKIISLQLGFKKFEEIRPKIYIRDKLNKKDYSNIVSIGIQSTAQAKYWNNPTGWQETVDYLRSKEMTVYCLDRSYSYGNVKADMWNIIPDNTIFEQGIDINKIVSILSVSKFFIGLSSGLSWLAWAIGIPVIMISGFSDPISEFTTKMYRVHTKQGCNSCFNRSRLDPKLWEWCPDQDENKKEMFECSKIITSKDVIKKINLLIYEKSFNKI